MNRILKSVFLLCSCVFSFAVCSAQTVNSEGKNEVQVGDTVPPFSVMNNQGERCDAASFLGQPVVLVFFNTGCRDCRKELPELQKLYEEMKSDVRFLCISRAEPDSAVSVFWQANALTMPYSAQPDKAVFHLFARRTIPRVYVVGRTGVISEKFVERVPMRKLRRAVLRACRE